MPKEFCDSKGHLNKSSKNRKFCKNNKTKCYNRYPKENEFLDNNESQNNDKSRNKNELRCNIQSKCDIKSPEKSPVISPVKSPVIFPTVNKYIVSGLIGLITGTVNGLLGSGGGTITVPAMVHFLGADEHKAHATAILVILPITIVSVFFYISNNFVDWNITYKVILGGMLGGYAGAKLLNICPESILRKIFGAFMILAAVRMLMN